MLRHKNDSGIYIRSIDERVCSLQVYKPGSATHMKNQFSPLKQNVTHVCTIFVTAFKIKLHTYEDIVFQG